MAGSSDAERDSDFAGHNGDSDIEILSNPSQSSIEVLEYNASRKHSEDRRYDTDFVDPAMVLSLDSMADQINRLSVSERHQQTSTQDLLAESKAPGAIGAAVVDDRKTALSQAHLTESSSSGSVTDSICTTYEPSRMSPLVKSQNECKAPAPTDNNRSPEKQSKGDGSVLSSMFGGELIRDNYLLSLMHSTKTVLEFVCRTFPINKQSYVAQPTCRQR